MLPIGFIALLVSLDALAHSYAGLYGWAVHHRLSGWQALTWPAEVDVFLVVGELALCVAYLDAWPARQRRWPWVTAVVGLTVSTAGNVGHVTALPGQPVTAADRITAAVSPVAAFAGLMIGLLVLKMSRARPLAAAPVQEHASAAETPGTDATARDEHASDLLEDAARLLEAAETSGQILSQRALAAHLRSLGHHFSNAQLRSITSQANSTGCRQAA